MTAPQRWRTLFADHASARRYLDQIPDLAKRQATAEKLGMDQRAERVETSPPIQSLPTQQKQSLWTGPPALPGFGPLRTCAEQQLDPDTHTFLGTLDGGALRFALPWGPSINHYWRHVLMPCKPGKPGSPPYRVQVMISREGRTYRRAVREALEAYRTWGPFTMPPAARLAVELTLRGPNRRLFDVDNYAKACLDALTHTAVWADDSLIDELHIQRGPIFPGGQVVVTVKPLAATLFEVRS